MPDRRTIVPGLQRLRDRYDAILLDLDGTLLDGEAQLTDRTVRAVRGLSDAGLFVVLCTGRSVTGTRGHHAALGLDTPVVAYNGSWIGDPDGEPEHYIPIPDDHLDAVFRIERASVFSFRHRAETKHTVMSEHSEHEAVASWFANVEFAPSPAALPNQDLMRVSMFFDERDQTASELRRRYWELEPDPIRSALRLESFPLRIFPNYRESSLLLFEVQGESRGKAEALDWLEGARGIPRARVIAVGDHMNDLSMLAEAGLAVVMANGVPEAQAHADVVIGHHAEEGVAEWIECGAPLNGNGRASQG